MSLSFEQHSTYCSMAERPNNLFTKMQYDGIFCRLEFNESNLFYALNKRMAPAFFWGKFNKRLEIPMSAIIDVETRSYMPYGRGLILRIKSGHNYEKVKTLAPINITGVPDEVLDKLLSTLKKNNDGQQRMMAS